MTVLNLAPVPEEAAGLLADQPAWLVVNAHEAAALLGAEAGDVAEAQAMAARLAAGGSRAGRPGATRAPWPARGWKGDGRGWQGGGGAVARGGKRRAVARGGKPGEPLRRDHAGRRGRGAGRPGRSRPPSTGSASRPWTPWERGTRSSAPSRSRWPPAWTRPRRCAPACAAGAAATTRRGAQEGLPRPADVLAATGFRWPQTAR